MSWRLGFGVMIAAVLSIAAVVIAIMSATGPGGAERIKAAIRWPANCAGVRVERPSRAPVMSRWASFTVQTADIVCGAAGPSIAYGRFRDVDSLDRAIADHQPSDRYCVFSESIVIDHLAGVDPTVFTDMCRSLGGTFVNIP